MVWNWGKGGDEEGDKQNQNKMHEALKDNMDILK